MHPVLGVWSLIDWQRIYADGRRVYPFGEKPVGLLAYMPDGRMMVQMLTRTRPLIDSPDPVGGPVNERAQAYSTCLAYFGTYKVLDNEVEHHIEASLYPNWTGKTTARGMAIEDGKLILRTDPSIVDGISVVNEMSWERTGLTHHQACSSGLTQQQTGNIYMVKPPSRGLGPTIGSTAARAKPLIASHQSDLDSLAPYMLMLMMRNVTSDGFVVEDPSSPSVYSLPGCIIAAPSFPANTPGVDQDYVYNWVRDAAITAIEIAAADLPTSGGNVQTLIDYVNFAATCYNNAVLSSQNNGITKGHACFTVSGKVRPWTEQSDGPALQTITILRAYDQLDEVTKRTAIDLIEKNLAYLLSVYREPTTNLWEEHTGDSFFARSVQLRCFREIAGNKIGIAVPNAVAEAITWLDNALAKH
jgi:lipocalin-like protein/glycosyl hydrolase family 15